MREKKTAMEYVREFILYGIPLLVTCVIITGTRSAARRHLEFSSGAIEQKKKDQDWRCGDCKNRSSELEGHHRVPIGLKGSRHYDNLVMLCPTCHRKWDHLAEHNKTIFDKDRPDGIPLSSAPAHLFLSVE
ncbi:MAG: HNH endonuclease [Candidatus Pacebacteria bacterium]|nr:HNH endonuclease [Candidatus Paceibacterota bacterium]